MSSGHFRKLPRGVNRAGGTSDPTEMFYERAPSVCRGSQGHLDCYHPGPSTNLETAMYDIDSLKMAARGHWPSIIRRFPGTGSSFVEQALQHWSRGSAATLPCPVHYDGKHGKTRWRFPRDFAETGGYISSCCGASGDGIGTLMWLNGWDFKEAAAALASYFGEEGYKLEPRKILAIQEAAKAERLVNDRRAIESLRQVWSESLAISDPAAKPAWRYLANRGLVKRVLSPYMRFHPSLPYYEARKLQGRYPAILVKLISPDGKQCVSIQRTYLTDDGHKAPVESPKKAMTAPSDRAFAGSAYRLDEPMDELAVAEGMETVLAVRSVYPRLACWFTSSDSLMAKMELPSSIRRLYVFADKDRNEAGKLAASALVTRAIAQGIDAVAYMPGMAIPEGKTNVDWNDALIQYGDRAFPRLIRVVAKAA